MSRPLKTYVDLEAIKHNYFLSKSLCPHSNAFAVVKANAYGHGAVQVASYLDNDVDAFAVASIDEALELREAAISSPVLLLEGIFEKEELPICESMCFWIVIENTTQLNHFINSSVEIDKVFLKIDTGMHRLGVDSSAVSMFLEQLISTGRIGEIVLMTHFSSADDLQSNATSEQMNVFEQVRSQYPELPTSVANSAGVLKHKLLASSWLRPGLMLYGISPFSSISANELGLKPAMTLKSKIISLRTVPDGETVGYGRAYEAKGDRVIATIAAGYGDGYPRGLDFSTPIIIRDEICFLSGRVSMDMITVDVTHLKEVGIGDEVILWGEGNPVEEVAAHNQTIGYELVTRMTGRSKIEYIK